MAATALNSSPYDLGQLGTFDKAATTSLLNRLEGQLVWSGADFKNEQSYTMQIDAQSLAEIRNALEEFKKHELDGEEVSKENFPLPNLGPQLEFYARNIHYGTGVFRLQGLDAASFTNEDNVIIYLGIADYIGDQRGLQDRKGNMLTHVTNWNTWTAPMHERHGIHSTRALPFHNDMGCDIMALQVRSSACSGGNTYLSSAWKVFNELQHSEPEVLQTLLTPDWPVQVSGRKARHYFAPVFVMHEGRLMVSMDPSRFGPHPKSDASQIPNLTFRQQYALQRVAEVAGEHELQLRLETGDLVFFNNWALLHRRDEYSDHGKTSRHMLRLWLRNSQLAWSVPKEMQLPWLAAFGENETRKVSARLYPIVPMPEYFIPKYSQGSAAFVIEDSEESDME